MRFPSSSSSIALLAVLALGGLGCSIMGTIQYFAPDAALGETKRRIAIHDYVSHGPGNQLVLRRSGQTIYIQAEAYNGWSIAAGPIYLTVIPFILPGFAFQTEIPWDEPGITIKLMFEDWPEEPDADLEDSLLALAGDDQTRTALEVTRDPRRDLGSSGHYDDVYLTFSGVDKQKLDEFTLTLGEIRVEGESLVIPRIHFTKARGLVKVVIP